MNSNTTNSIFTSLLLIAAIVITFGTEELYPSYELSSSDFGQQSSICQNNTLPFSVDLPSELNTDNQQTSIPKSASTITYSCSMSLQMIPVEKQLLFAPTESGILLTADNATPLPQTFVFQEPDPPRLG